AHVAGVVEAAVPGASRLEGRGLLAGNVLLEPATSGLTEREIVGGGSEIHRSRPAFRGRPLASPLPRYAGSGPGATGAAHEPTGRGRSSEEGTAADRDGGAAASRVERSGRDGLQNRGPPEHHVGHLGRGWAAEEISLPLVAPEATQLLELLPGLHALGNRLEPQRAGPA